MDFEVGSTYKRSDIHAALGGQQRGGISTPHNQPVILLFTGKSGEENGYQDGWEKDGFFHYSGEGQYGDMHMTKGNLAILMHAKNGKSLLLFDKVGKNDRKFLGYMRYASHYEKTLLDRNHEPRRGIIFRLAPVEVAWDDLWIMPKGVSFEILRDKALEASSDTPTKTHGTATHWDRSEAVATYVLTRAHGFCEWCGSPAPFFRRDGVSPYLETHHVQQVSDLGPDRPSSVLALCPTCHSRVHHGYDGRNTQAEMAGVPAAVERACEDGRLRVVTAALVFNPKGQVLVCQRSTGALAGYWEFPGGKERDNESPLSCIVREIREELRVELQNARPLTMVDHDYAHAFIRLLCFTGSIQGDPVLTEHMDARWIYPDELAKMNLAPADIEVSRRIARIGRQPVVPVAAGRTLTSCGGPLS